MLDGLDELESSRQELCIQKINEFLTQYWQVGEIVICSRTEEYEVQNSKFVLNGAIILQPLTENKIKDFICCTGGEKLWENVRDDPKILELAKSPLLLDVIVISYQEILFEEWNKVETSEAKQYYLWEAYIARMLSKTKNNNKKHRFSKQKYLKHLRWLAWQLTVRKQTEFFIESLQPAFLNNNIQLWIYCLIGGIIGGSIGSLAGMIFVGIIFTPKYGTLFGFLAGFLSGPFYVLIGENKIVTSESLRLSMSKIRADFFPNLYHGIRYGILYSMCLGLIYTFVKDFKNGFFLFLGYWIIYGLTYAIVKSVTVAEISIKRIANQGIKYSIINSLLLSCVGLPVGFFVALFFGQFHVIDLTLTKTIILGMGCSLACAADSGGLSAACKHLALRIVLTMFNYIPWNYAVFLDDCTDHLFLQRVGGSYRFIHRLLQEQLAKQYKNDFCLRK